MLWIPKLKGPERREMLWQLEAAFGALDDVMWRNEWQLAFHILEARRPLPDGQLWWLMHMLVRGGFAERRDAEEGLKPCWRMRLDAPVAHGPEEAPPERELLNGPLGRAALATLPGLDYGEKWRSAEEVLDYFDGRTPLGEPVRVMLALLCVAGYVERGYPEGGAPGRSEPLWRRRFDPIAGRG